MFNKTQSSADRLNAWRAVRNREHKTVDSLLACFAPIKPIPRYIDYYTPRDWPNVFDIVSDGYLCQSGITLVLAATLCHTGFITDDELYFEVISNHTNGNDGLVLIHNNLAYNFTPGKAISMQEVIDNSTRFNSHKVKTSSLFA